VQKTIATTNEKLVVATKDAKRSLEPADVETIRNDDEQQAYERLQKPGWGDLWSGGDVGLAGTTGNAETLTFTSGINGVRLLQRYECLRSGQWARLGFRTSGSRLA
jgi:hypothetical protein